MTFKVIAGQGAGWSSGADLDLDSAGDAFVVGGLDGTVDFDPGPGTSALASTGSGTDFYLARYDTDGSLVWAISPDSSTNFEVAGGVALDPGGNPYVGGSFLGSVDFDPGVDTEARVSTGTTADKVDFFLAHYLKTGQLEWVATPVSSSRNEAINDVDSDASANAYVVGSLSGTAVFAAGYTLGAGPVFSDTEIFIAKYNSDGTLQWAVGGGNPGGDIFGAAIAVDGPGNSYVTGSFRGTVDFDPGAGTALLTSTGSDLYVAKFDSAGSLAWVRTTGPSLSSEDAYDIALDGSGNVFITGRIDGSVDFDPGPGTAVVEGFNGASYYVAKYDSAGSFQWVRTPQTNAVEDVGAAVTADDDGNAYVTGYFRGTVDFDGGPGTAVLVSQGLSNHFVAKYDASGALQWVRTAGPSSDDEFGSSVEVDGTGDVALVGNFDLTVDFDPRPGSTETRVAGTDGSIYKHFLARYTPEGLLGYPETTIVSGPASLTTSSVAAFDFAADSGTATYERSLDGGSFVAATDPLTLSGLGEGTHTLLVRATDGDGNTDQTPAAHTWTVDTTAPDTTISTAVGALTNQTTAAFDFSSGEAGVTYQASLDGASFAAVGDPHTYSALGEGLHSLAVRAVDAAGNLDASPATFIWLIDTTPPDTSIVTGPSGTTASTTAAFDFASEGGASFEARLDGGSFAAASDPYTLSGLGNGVHTLQVRAVDGVGNRDASPATVVWTVDVDPPETTISTDALPFDGRTTAVFDFSADESPVTYDVVVDGTTFAAAADPFTLTGLADGPHTVLARAVDDLGNADPSPASFTWTVDTAPPDTTIIAGPAAVTNQTTAAFDFLSDDGAASFEGSLDGASFAAVGDPATFTGLAEGVHTLLVRAVDLAGNADTSPTEQVWTIDLTPPEPPTVDAFADNTGDTADAVTADRTLVVTGTAGPGEIVHVFRDGVERATVAAGGDGVWTFDDRATTLAFGRHEYGAVAEDAAGNLSTPAEPLQVFVAGAAAGDGPDVLLGGARADIIDARNGDDSVWGDGGNDTLKGGNGNDSLLGGADSDALWGGNGNDGAQGGDGDDTIFGESGADTLTGGDGRDRLEGGAGGDVILGEDGDDSISGGDGRDVIGDGPGHDRIQGDGDGDLILLDLDGTRDSVYGTVAQLSGDTLGGFVTGKEAAGDVIVVTGLAASQGKYLDSIVLTGNVLSLAKVGGGQITFDDLDAGPHWTDTVLGSDGGILLYVV